MRLRLFAPLRAKITSSVRSTEPCWSPQLRICRSQKNSTPRRILCEAVRPKPMTGQADQVSEKVKAHKNSELASIGEFQSFTAQAFLHVAVVYRCALGTPYIRGCLRGNRTTCTIRHLSARA